MEEPNQYKRLKGLNSIKNFWWIIVVPVVLVVISTFIRIFLFPTPFIIVFLLPTFLISLLIFISWGMKTEETFKSEQFIGFVLPYRKGQIGVGSMLGVTTIIASFIFKNQLRMRGILPIVIGATGIILVITCFFVVGFFRAVLSLSEEHIKLITANKIQFCLFGSLGITIIDIIAVFEALRGLYDHYPSFKVLVFTGMVLATVSVISALLMGLLILGKEMRRRNSIHYLFAIVFAFLVGTIIIFVGGELTGFLLF